MAQTRPDARRKRFPANAVVCLYHAELSTTYDTVLKKQVRLIIPLRESDLGPQSPGAAAASFPSRTSEHFGRSDTRVWRGFHYFPRSLDPAPQCLRIRRRQPLLRRPAKERENSIHFRSAPTRNLRQLAVPALRCAALLVSESPSRPANRYLSSARSRAGNQFPPVAPPSRRLSWRRLAATARATKTADEFNASLSSPSRHIAPIR